MQVIVPDMTCRYCVYDITQSLKLADPLASIEISIAQKRVRVESRLAAETLLRAIEAAGFSPQASGAG